MSRSYRRCYHNLGVRDEKKGLKEYKQQTNRVMRHRNKQKVVEAQTLDEHEPKKPYLTKHHLKNFYLMTDGKIEATPEFSCGQFHFKKLAKGKVRMIK